MQLLVYIFICLFGLAIGIAAYLGLTFTPIESLLSGIVATTLAIVIFERTLRVRSHKRFEKAIEDLSRLLSTNAQAGQVLSKRVNKITDINAGSRLDIVEADISVFGTIVRQVAEAVAQLEEAQAQAQAENNNNYPSKEKLQDEQNTLTPKISSAEVKKALDDGRIIIYAQSIITLPKRQERAFALMPMMQLENNQVAKAAEFMPVSGNEAMVSRIDQLGLKRAFEYLLETQDISLLKPINVPISKFSLRDSAIVEWIIAQLDISREKASYISLAISESQYNELDNKEKINLSAMIEKGASISLNNVNNLRLDFSHLKQQGVNYVHVDASSFIDNPESFTDYQSSDVAPYLNRFGLDLIMDNVQNEQQVLVLLEDRIGMIMGDYLAPAKPALSILKPIDETTKTAI